MLDGQFPDVATMLGDAAEDLLAFTGLPQAHWRKLWSTNPLERLNGEIKWRTNVVGIFPNDAAVARLVTAVVVVAHDEWAVAERRYLSEESMAKLHTQPTAESVIEETPLAIPPGPQCRRRTAQAGIDLHHLAGRDHPGPISTSGDWAPRSGRARLAVEIEPGTVLPELFDHASIPATVRALFAPRLPPLTARNTAANTFHLIMTGSPGGQSRGRAPLYRSHSRLQGGCPRPPQRASTRPSRSRPKC